MDMVLKVEHVHKLAESVVIEQLASQGDFNETWTRSNNEAFNK